MPVMGCFITRWARYVAAVVALSLASVHVRAASADLPSDRVAGVVAKVSPAVVRIITVRLAKPGEETPGPKVASAAATDAAATDQTSTAIGSGFIIDPTGFIATNKHVVEDAAALYVMTSDGVRYKASVVGMPGKSDMALIRVYAGHALPSVPFGNSDKMRVGDPVIAIGSPFGFDNSVTSGIISAVNRDIMESPFDDYLQTDASINHGNSGGPLFNLSGEVIGMNSVIFAPTTGSVGLGFAIPSNDLEFVFNRLMKTGEIKAGMLPIHTQQVTWMLKLALGAPDLQGALVSAVNDEGGTMLQGKIRPGDIIMSFNGQKVWDPRDLARKAAWSPIGSDATLEICQDGVQETVQVKIQAWPDAKPVVLRDDDEQRKLGLELASTRSDKGDPAVAVTAVDPMGTAADSGIQKGDIILEIQQTPVSDPDQALRLFWVQSSMRHHFAAVLVERDKKLSWMPLAVPD
jgi:serine protease Do